MNILLNSPVVNLEVTRDIEAPKGKGKQIMEGLLLDQYTNSTNLKEYYMCFIAEFDLIFEQLHNVYFGRFIENAVGAQLDVIGIILQQSRSVILPTIWFGFQGVPNIEGMADEAAPAIGGTFKDENIGEGKITPIDDILYRRMLLAKAALMNKDADHLSLVYHVISILINRVPSVFQIREGYSDPTLDKRRVDLKISRSAVTEQEVKLILYMAKYFVPAGITFTITKV